MERKNLSLSINGCINAEVDFLASFGFISIKDSQYPYALLEDLLIYLQVVTSQRFCYLTIALFLFPLTSIYIKVQAVIKGLE